MPRSTLVSMRFVLLLAVMAGCGGSTVGPDGATGGAAGAGGGAAGTGGGVAGTGGGSAGAGGSGGAPLTTCPTARPSSGTPCAGSFSCNYTDMVRCNVACYSGYMCANDHFMFLGNNDGCLQVTCTPDAGTDGATP